MAGIVCFLPIQAENFAGQGVPRSLLLLLEPAPEGIGRREGGAGFGLVLTNLGSAVSCTTQSRIRRPAAGRGREDTATLSPSCVGPGGDLLRSCTRASTPAFGWRAPHSGAGVAAAQAASDW